MGRGARAWNQADSSPDLFGLDLAPPAATPAPAPAGRASRRYTDRENRRLERVLPAFVAWLRAATVAQLEGAKTRTLMIKWAPMRDWDIEQMVSVELAHRRRRPRR